LTGLKPSQIKALEKLYRRRISPKDLVSLDLAREMCVLSRELRRQVCILANRFGEVEYVIVGDERSIFIPELADYPLGKKAPAGTQAHPYPSARRAYLQRRSH
jgi:GTPase